MPLCRRGRCGVNREMQSSGRTFYAATGQKFSQKQMQVLTWWREPHICRRYDAVICDGAVRSGKTFCLALSFILWALQVQNGGQVAMCGKTILSLHRNVVVPLKRQLLQMGIGCRERQAQNQMEVFCRGRSIRVYFFGGKDESAADSIQGLTLGGILLDEVALMPRSFVEQALARCSDEKAAFWFSCNPETPEHWFYKEWICKAREKRALYLHFTMLDNPALSDTVRKRYETLYSGRFYERFILGRWTAPEGQVYDMFGAAQITMPPKACSRYAVSCDYGTVNPMSMGLWGEKDGVWYRIQESYYDARRTGQRRTDEQHYAQLCSLVGDRQVEAVIADPSAASFLECIREHGKFMAVAAENRVLEGIAAVSDWLMQGKLKIAPWCKDSIREFGLYCWEKNGKESPRKEFDHAMDDIRYFVLWARKKTEPQGFFALPAMRKRG